MTQNQQDVDRVIAYANFVRQTFKPLIKRQRKYFATKGELNANVLYTQCLGNYLMGLKFKIGTDHIVFLA